MKKNFMFVCIALLFAMALIVSCDNSNKTPSVEKFTVTFDPNGGGQSYKVEVESGKTIPTQEIPTREGYSFDGWYLNDTKYDFSKPVTSNIKLVAKWNILKLTVTFNTTGGNSIDPKTIDYGTTLVLPDNPTQEGLYFLGWILDNTLFDDETLIKKNITLKALWGDADSIEAIEAFNSTNYIGYTTLDGALTNATVDDTVILSKDIAVTSQINLPEGVILDGNNHTIKASDNATWSNVNGSKMLLQISSDATVRNVILDSNRKACGVQVYAATGVKLENVTLKNSINAGLLINASQVVVSGKLAMSGNSWGNYINLGWGLNVQNAPAKCTLGFVNATLEGIDNIWTDSDDLRHAGVTQDNWGDKFAVEGLEFAKTKVNNGVAWVPPIATIGNNNYATLNDALEASNDNDVIKIVKGEFISTELINISKSVIIEGAGIGNTVFIIPGGDTTSTGAININASNVVFKGIELKATGGSHLAIKANKNNFNFIDSAITGSFDVQSLDQDPIMIGIGISAGTTGTVIDGATFTDCYTPVYASTPSFTIKNSKWNSGIEIDQVPTENTVITGNETLEVENYKGKIHFQNAGTTENMIAPFKESNPNITFKINNEVV